MEWEKKARNLKQPAVTVRLSLTFSTRIGIVDGLTASAAGVGPVVAASGGRCWVVAVAALTHYVLVLVKNCQCQT